ncbi:hypothetical protein Hgul01_05228 [Herpetosiphon gulosus]|uniref:Transposase n=1 Tax=Herpetosiphon gulosus TaxID=1973496 RepID=A0ABP9X980_9CHLR
MRATNRGRLLEILHRRDVLCSEKSAAARFRSDDMRCLLVYIMFCGPWLIESLPYPDVMKLFRA